MSKVIRFLVKQSPYNAGEVAGFADEICEKYVNAKVAEFVPSEESEAEPASADAEYWKKKFYDQAAAHEKQNEEFLTASAADDVDRGKIVEQLGSVELERDQLLRQVNELVGAIHESPLPPEGANTALAGPVDQSGAPIDVTNKEDAGAQEDASGINQASRAAETERRAGRRR